MADSLNCREDMALIESLLTGNDGAVTFNYLGPMWFRREWPAGVHFWGLRVVGGDV